MVRALACQKVLHASVLAVRMDSRDLAADRHSIILDRSESFRRSYLVSFDRTYLSEPSTYCELDDYEESDLPISEKFHISNP